MPNHLTDSVSVCTCVSTSITYQFDYNPLYCSLGCCCLQLFPDSVLSVPTSSEASARQFDRDADQTGLCCSRLRNVTRYYWTSRFCPKPTDDQQHWTVRQVAAGCNWVQRSSMNDWRKQMIVSCLYAVLQHKLLYCVLNYICQSILYL